MKKKVLAFGASNSKKSINKKFAIFATSMLKEEEIQILDLNDFEMPIYSIDRENESGIPEQAYIFKKCIQDTDGIIISFAEHNGAYTAAFKNIMDWTSRLAGSVWENKPMLLLATSPGGRGGQTVLGLASSSFRFMNKNTINSFSLPSFNSNYSEEAGIVNKELLNSFKEQVNLFQESVNDKLVSSQ